MKNRITHKKGITLIELLLSLGIIALLMVAIFFVFKKVDVSNKAKEEAERIIRISSIYETNVPTVVATGQIINDNYAAYKDGTTMLINLYKLEGLIPADAKNGENDEFSNMTTAVFTNKFGGVTTVGPGNIQMTGIPIEACGVIVNPIIAKIGENKSEYTVSCSEAMKDESWNGSDTTRGVLIYDIGEKSIEFYPDDGNGGSGGSAMS